MEQEEEEEVVEDETKHEVEQDVEEPPETMDMVSWLQDDQPVVGMWKKQDLLYEMKRKGQVVRAYFSDWTPYTLQGQRWGLTHNGTCLKLKRMPHAKQQPTFHVQLWQDHHKDAVRNGFHIHHGPIRNPRNNCLGNLQKMLAQGHLRHHGSEAGRPQKKLKRAS